MKHKYNKTIIMEMFVSLLPSQILSALTTSLSTIINGYLIGNFLSQAALAAMGFVSPLNGLMAGFAAIISAGSRIVLGRCIGKGENSKISNVYSSCLFMLFFIGGLFTAVVFLFPETVSSILGAKDSAVVTTAAYIKGLSLGIIPTMTIPTLLICLQMMDHLQFSFFSTLFMVITNITFSSANIFLFKGNIMGMGIASSAAQWLSAILIFVYSHNRIKELHFSLANCDIKIAKQIAIFGSPGALSNMLSSVANIYVNAVCFSIGGVSAVAALSIVCTVGSFFESIDSGIESANSTLCSIFAGEKDKGSLKMLFNLSFAIMTAVSVLKYTVIFAFGHYILLLFGASSDVLLLGDNFLRIYGLYMFICMIRSNIVAQFSVLEEIGLVNTYFLFNYFVFPMAVVFLLHNVIGITAIWICYLLSEMICLSILYLYKAAAKHKFNIGMEDIFGYDEKLKKAEKKYVSIENIDEAINLSIEIIDFLKENGVDKTTANKCGLCLEEMAVNIVEHGFTKAKKDKKCYVDIFVGINEDHSIDLRLRDNAPSFDPRVKFGAMDPEDPCKNMGIRMVQKLARNISYQNYFGMNVLSIEL